jgi:hypothetical protein
MISRQRIGWMRIYGIVYLVMDGLIVGSDRKVKDIDYR